MTRYSVFVVALLTIGFGGRVGFGRVAGGNVVGTVAGTSAVGGSIVYIDQVPGTFAPTDARMDQKKMDFVPHILPVVVGTTVTFLNSDPVPHVVFSNDFEKLVFAPQRPDESRQHTFAKCAKFPCVYTILCPTHTEMEGFIVVLQNPFFAVSDSDGHYKIENVPEGKYNIGIWNENLKARVEPVTVTSGSASPIDFKLTK